MNIYNAAIREELKKIPVPGDMVTKIFNNVAFYGESIKLELQKNSKLEEGDIVKIVHYQLDEKGLHISINHQVGTLDKNEEKTVSKNKLIKVTRRIKLEKLKSC